MNTDFNELVDNVLVWADERGIFAKATPIAQYRKTVEEVDELRIALDADDKEEIKDAIGDITVTLIIQAAMHNMDIVECLEHAYNNIKDRKGKMVNGQFVKEIPQQG